MGLWSKGIHRGSDIQNSRLETIGSILKDLNDIRNFINKFLFNHQCEFVLDGDSCRWFIPTDIGNYEVLMKLSPDDFDYSIFLFLKMELSKFIFNHDDENKDYELFRLINTMSNNLTKYILSSISDDFRSSNVLYEI